MSSHRLIKPQFFTSRSSFSFGFGSTFMKEIRILQQLKWTLNKTLVPTTTSSKGFHTSPATNVDHRKKKSIVRHLNYINHEKTLKHNYNPLVSLPDYTYLDGRPTEIMISQKLRDEKNTELAKQVVQLVEETKFAQQQLVSQEKAKKAYARQRQDSKLKQKDQELT